MTLQLMLHPPKWLLAHAMVGVTHSWTLVGEVMGVAAIKLRPAFWARKTIVGCRELKPKLNHLNDTRSVAHPLNEVQHNHKALGKQLHKIEDKCSARCFSSYMPCSRLVGRL